MKIGFDVYDEDLGLLGTFDLDDAVEQLARCGPHKHSRAWDK